MVSFIPFPAQAASKEPLMSRVSIPCVFFIDGKRDGGGIGAAEGVCVGAGWLRVTGVYEKSPLLFVTVGSVPGCQ